MSGCSFALKISGINDVKGALKQSEYVVSSDSVILDYYRSWINLVPELLKKCGSVWLIDLDLTGTEERKSYLVCRRRRMDYAWCRCG